MAAKSKFTSQEMKQKTKKKNGYPNSTGQF